jgi:hypothetical protein
MCELIARTSIGTAVAGLVAEVVHAKALAEVPAARPDLPRTVRSVTGGGAMLAPESPAPTRETGALVPMGAPPPPENGMMKPTTALPVVFQGRY